MGSLFAKASAGVNLTPAERALIRFVQGLVATALVAALPVVADALARQSVNWQDVLRAALGAATAAVLLALHKYATAQGDVPLSDETVSLTPKGQAAVQQQPPAA